MGDDSFNDLVRALAAIHTNSQNSEITNVAKVGSTVEYFRALVEAQKESSRKQTESESLKHEHDVTPEVVEPLPGSNSGNEPWLPLIPSDEFLNMLKNAQTFAGSNTTEPENHAMWDKEDLPISNISSFFSLANSSFTFENDLYTNGTFQLPRDMSGFTGNLSNLKDILGTFKQNLDESSKLSDSVIYSLIAIYSAVIVVGLLGMDIKLID